MLKPKKDLKVERDLIFCKWLEDDLYPNTVLRVSKRKPLQYFLGFMLLVPFTVAVIYEIALILRMNEVSTADLLSIRAGLVGAGLTLSTSLAVSHFRRLSISNDFLLLLSVHVKKCDAQGVKDTLIKMF